MGTLDDRLDADYADAWRPQPDDKLLGEIVAIGERTGQFDSYPILTVRQDDGTELAFHAFHTVATNELAKHQPKVGERIGVKYLGQRIGQGGTRYHAYRVQVDRADAAGVDWGKYSSDGLTTTPEPEPTDSPSVPQYGEPATKPGAVDDDSVPF